MKRVLLSFILLFVVACSPVGGYTHQKIEPVPSTAFSPIYISSFKWVDIPTPKPTATPTQKPRKVVSPAKTQTLQGKHGSVILSGRASYYCSPRYPTCTHGYPLGSIVGAACAKLRNVFPNWRGKFVVVKSGNRSITVQLVDWCGSKDKVIDLYYAAMVKLGGTGVLPVTIYRR